MALELSDVQNIFITHLHEDHMNGIQQLAYYHQIVSKKKPNLYVPESILDDLWNVIKIGLDRNKYLNDYFDVFPLYEHDSFYIEGQNFKPIKTNHVSYLDSYGLLAKNQFYFSGDSNVDKTFLTKINDEVKTIFHDCHLWDLYISSHASLEDIKALPEEIKEKIVLMHYHDGYSGEGIKQVFENREKLLLARQLQTFEF
ncbi:ribonuclease Z [compost metagenome]